MNKWAGRKIILCTGLTRAARQDKNLLYRHDEPNKPTEEGPLSYVLQEFPFASVSSVNRGHPSLASLPVREVKLQKYRVRFLAFCFPFDECVDEVDAGELDEGREHGHETEDHVDVHGRGVTHLEYGFR